MENRYICDRLRYYTYATLIQHQGTWERKIIARITERFHWIGIVKDVKWIVKVYRCVSVHYVIVHYILLYISTCDVCQRVNRKMVIQTPELNSIPVKSHWHHVSLDFVGPITPVSSQGNRYILTVSDYFTKFVEAVLLPSKSAPGAAGALFKVTIHEFNSNLHKEFTDLYANGNSTTIEI